MDLAGTVNGGAVVNIGTSDAGPASTPATTDISGVTVIDGTTTVFVAGVISQTAELYVGYSAGSAAVLNVVAGSTWTDTGQSIASAGGGSDTFANAGTFSFQGGAAAAVIDPAVVNTGTMNVASGLLHLVGPVSGGGSFEIGSNATIEVTGTAFDPTASVSFMAVTGLLWVEGGGTFSLGSIDPTSKTDYIDLTGFTYDTAKPLALSGGVLTVSDGTNVAHITVGTAATLADFQQQDLFGAIGISHS